MSESGNIKVSQVTGNFHRIARDLDRALRAARFTTNERFFIDEARELSWGSVPPDAEPLPFRFNFLAVERLHGIQRTKAKQAVRSLVASRVFIATEGEMYLINKDYREWLDEDGSPRLSGDQLAWCFEVRRRAHKPARGESKQTQGGESIRTHAGESKQTHCTDAQWVQTDSGGESKQTQGGESIRTHAGESKQTHCTDAQWVQTDSGGESKQTQGGESKQTHQNDPPLTSPPEIQRKERDREKRDVGRAHADARTDAIGPAGAHAREDAPQPAPVRSAPAYPSDPLKAPDTIALGKHPEDPAWAAEFWGRLWEAFGVARVLWDFYRHQRWYSRECWEAALRKAVRQGTRVEAGAYLERIAAGFEATGIPDDEPAKPRRFNPIAENRKAVSAILRGEKAGGRS